MMKILNAKVTMDPNTYEPILETTIQMSIDILVYGSDLVGAQEQAQIIGQAFIDAYKTFKEDERSNQRTAR